MPLLIRAGGSTSWHTRPGLIRQASAESRGVLPLAPQNARSRRVAERSGARAAGQMDVVGLTWDRYVWPLATGGAARLQPAATP